MPVKIGGVMICALTSVSLNLPQLNARHKAVACRYFASLFLHDRLHSQGDRRATVVVRPDRLDK